MDPTKFSPDEVVYWQWGPVELNLTLVATWVVMILLVGFAWLVTRRLTMGPSPGKRQSLLEVFVEFMRNEIRNISHQDPDPYLPFIGTLFIFILASNIMDVVPGFVAPTGSLSTTAALAICVFFSVPIFGVAKQGLGGYLKNYIQPSPVMLPFHVIGELSRTLALAVRLFGNVMSGTKVVAILVSLVPFFAPVVMNLLGLLIGVIQAYIFAVLAMVYISSGMEAHEKQSEKAAEMDEGQTETAE